MTWLAWRQHRRQALYALAALVALAAVIVPTGLKMYDALADTGLATCLDGLGDGEFVPVPAATACEQLSRTFTNAYSAWQLPVVLLVLLPALVGLFFGAPLVAREVEQGTHRLVWTQGVTRLRWSAVKLTMIGLGAIAVALAHSALTTWWLTPLALAMRGTGRFGFPFFDLYGPAPVAYTLFAVALGVLAGTITRKVLPAMAITLFGFIGARTAVTIFARPRYQPAAELSFPATTDRMPNPARGDWILVNNVYDGTGRLVDPNGIRICPPAASGCDTLGLVNRWTVQPGDRFWLFQTVEAGIFVVVAVVLAYVAVRIVRRRLS